jgi:hypothetical protein
MVSFTKETILLALVNATDLGIEMLGKFWEGVGSKLADRWAAISVPALVFWLGGLLSWTLSHGGWSHLAASTHWLTSLSAVGQLTVALTVLLAVAGSGLIVIWLTFPVLRILEGYWPRYCRMLRRLIIARIISRRADADIKKWNTLSRVLDSPSNATAEERSDFTRADRRRRRRPALPADYMPTRTGNILRAAETWPTHKYGLDSVITWPRLWLLLPDSVRQELIAARARLDSAVASVIWGLLFCSFAAWTPLSLLAGLGIAAGAIAFWVPSKAETFGDLVEACYDLYRASLYEQLRWPLPTSPGEEVDSGKALTEYLWRGTSAPHAVFAQPPQGSPGTPRRELASQRRTRILVRFRMRTPDTR